MVVYDHRSRVYQVNIEEPNAELKDKLIKLRYECTYDGYDNFIIHVENAQRLARLATLLAQFE
jgi:hypothetical protein